MRGRILKVLFSLFVFCVALLLVEGAFRLFHITLKQPPIEIFSMTPSPYFGFINTPHYNGKYQMFNQLSKQMFEGTRSTNNWGYRADLNFQYSSYYQRQNNERVVLVTGGSAMAGAGASQNSSTIDARLQHHLNRQQTKYKYTVLNFAQGGWVAFQQSIGLMMFGSQLMPDWVVAMDGRNDIAVCCDCYQGAGAHMFYRDIESYINGYLVSQSNSYYRGKLENELIGLSYAYRQLTGKKYVPNTQTVFNAHGIATVGTEVTWDGVEKQLDFYLNSQKSMSQVSDKAKCIYSLQPLQSGHKIIFQHSQDEMKSNAVKYGMGAPAYQFAIYWFYKQADLELRKLAASQRAQGRNASYTYSGIVFGETPDSEGRYFLDEAHLTDEGADLVAQLYAQMILRSDFPERQEECDREISKLNKVTGYKPDF